MATIRKLPSGKWNVQIRRHGHQPVTQSFTFEKDARRWARTIESEQDRGVFIDRSEAEATTLGEALSRYPDDVTSGFAFVHGVGYASACVSKNRRDSFSVGQYSVSPLRSLKSG
jgi:hypothetical protein